MLAYDVIPGGGGMQPDTRDFVLLKGESGGLHLIYHQTLPFWKKTDVPDSTPLIPGALRTDTDCFIIYLTHLVRKKVIYLILSPIAHMKQSS